MSNISNLHTIEEATDSSKAYQGQRLARIVYRNKADASDMDFRKSQVCSIPCIAISELTDSAIHNLKPWILEQMAGVQDKIVRARHEAGATSVHSEEVSLAACIAFLEVEQQGGRLTKEVIGAWFAEEVADVLTVALSDRLGLSDTPTPEECKKVEQMINVYRDCFAGLAGGRTTYARDKAVKLLKVLELVPSEGLSARFATRLEKMTQSDEELLGL